MTRIPSRLLLATTIFIGPAALAVPPRYEIVDLGVLGDPSNTNVAANATGLNELGHVAGVAEDDDIRIHAVLWRDGEVIDLGGLIENGGGYAKGVNDLGHVVGWAAGLPPDGGPGGTSRPFMWTEDAGMVDPAYPSGFNGEAWGINNYGQLAITLSQAHSWDPVQGLVKIQFDDEPEGNWGSSAWEVNNNGIVCGEARRADFFLHAFRYDIATNLIEPLAHDVAVDRNTIAYGLNDLDDVVGYSDRQDNFGQSMIWRADGSVIRFPLQPFAPQFAYDSAEHINNYGDVVGKVISALPEPPIGWIAYDVLGEEGPVQIDLRTLLTPADQLAWPRLSPFEINDRGQICGTGVVNGATRAFLMTPCVSDGDVDMNGEVDFSDLLLVLADWGGTGRREDADRDGSVGFSDLLIVLNEWGTKLTSCES